MMTKPDLPANTTGNLFRYSCMRFPRVFKMRRSEAEINGLYGHHRGGCEPSADGSPQLRCRSEVNGSQAMIKNSGVGYLIDAG
jgi:hypothetical protein